ncbi:MAG: T9SS type A sorting domain-containing protein, partial [Bacteroidota bacterium]
YYWDLGFLGAYDVDKIFLRELIPANLNGISQIVATAGSSFKETDCVSDNNTATRTHTFFSFGLTENQDINKSNTEAINWLQDPTNSLSDQVGIFPNPVYPGSMLSLNLPKVEADMVSIEWIDPLGRIRQQQDYSITGGVIQLPTTGLEPGIYWVRFLLDGEWITKKLLISQP